jgi:hypothetical protein
MDEKKLPDPIMLQHMDQRDIQKSEGRRIEKVFHSVRHDAVLLMFDNGTYACIALGASTPDFRPKPELLLEAGLIDVQAFQSFKFALKKHADLQASYQERKLYEELHQKYGEHPIKKENWTNTADTDKQMQDQFCLLGIHDGAMSSSGVHDGDFVETILNDPVNYPNGFDSALLENAVKKNPES